MPHLSGTVWCHAAWRHRISQLEQRLPAQPGEWQAFDLVFTATKGGPLDARWVARQFEAESAKVGLPRVRFHDLRHSHATQLLMAGEHLKVVQEHLGHSLIRETLDTYSHVLAPMQREAADKAERLVM